MSKQIVVTNLAITGLVIQEVGEGDAKINIYRGSFNIEVVPEDFEDKKDYDFLYDTLSKIAKKKINATTT